MSDCNQTCINSEGHTVVYLPPADMKKLLNQIRKEGIEKDLPKLKKHYGIKAFEENLHDETEFGFLPWEKLRMSPTEGYSWFKCLGEHGSPCLESSGCQWLFSFTGIYGLPYHIATITTNYIRKKDKTLVEDIWILPDALRLLIAKEKNESYKFGVDNVRLPLKQALGIK